MSTAVPAAGWHVVPLSGVAPQPWKNGGGTTRELLAWPAGADWQVRLSVADVTVDGPFSGFPGVERWFAVLRGAGVRLRLGGAAHEITPRSEPFVFDGGAAPDCELVQGATLDFNLMTRDCRGRLRRLRAPGWRGQAEAGRLLALFACDATARIMLDGAGIDVAPATLAWRVMAHDAELAVEAQDALWVEIEVAQTGSSENDA